MLCSCWGSVANANANAPELPFWSGRAAADLLLKKRNPSCVGSAVCEGLLWCSFSIELVWISRLWTSRSWLEGSAPADDRLFVVRWGRTPLLLQQLPQTTAMSKFPTSCDSEGTGERSVRRAGEPNPKISEGLMRRRFDGCQRVLE